MSVVAAENDHGDLDNYSITEESVHRHNQDFDNDCVLWAVMLHDRHRVDVSFVPD